MLLTFSNFPFLIFTLSRTAALCSGEKTLNHFFFFFTQFSSSRFPYSKLHHSDLALHNNLFFFSFTIFMNTKIYSLKSTWTWLGRVQAIISRTQKSINYISFTLFLPNKLFTFLLSLFYSYKNYFRNSKR